MLIAEEVNNPFLSFAISAISNRSSSARSIFSRAWIILPLFHQSKFWYDQVDLGIMASKPGNESTIVRYATSRRTSNTDCFARIPSPVGAIIRLPFFHVSNNNMCFEDTGSFSYRFTTPIYLSIFRMCTRSKWIPMDNPMWTSGTVKAWVHLRVPTCSHQRPWSWIFKFVQGIYTVHY